MVTGIRAGPSWSLDAGGGKDKEGGFDGALKALGDVEMGEAVGCMNESERENDMFKLSPLSSKYKRNCCFLEICILKKHRHHRLVAINCYPIICEVLMQKYDPLATESSIQEQQI